METILVYSERNNPRLDYILEHLTHLIENAHFKKCQTLEEYLSFEGVSINYSQQVVKVNELWIQDKGFLNFNIQQTLVNLNETIVNGIPVIFSLDSPNSYPHDLFAAAFWLLSRAEEYGIHDVDIHERFKSSHSWCAKVNCLNKPIVDSWISNFLLNINSMFKRQFKLESKRFIWSIGIDIDHAWKYINKPSLNNGLGFIRDLLTMRFTKALERGQVLLGIKKDPFDTYSLFKQLNLAPDQIIFFILSGGNSAYDKNVPLSNDKMKQLILDLKKFYQIGLHPSYNTYRNKKMLHQEKSNLEKIVLTPITKSRQHYLRLKFPDTYHYLTESGILEDYTMGYPDVTGFRAGTCFPFYWYDLVNERTTTLRVFPFCAMDRTLLTYNKKTPDQAFLTLQELSKTVKEYGGHFHMVWHNSSFDEHAEWKEWTTLFFKIVRDLKT